MLQTCRYCEVNPQPFPFTINRMLKMPLQYRILVSSLQKFAPCWFITKSQSKSCQHFGASPKHYDLTFCYCKRGPAQAGAYKDGLSSIHPAGNPIYGSLHKLGRFPPSRGPAWGSGVCKPGPVKLPQLTRIHILAGGDGVLCVVAVVLTWAQLVNCSWLLTHRHFQNNKTTT